MGTSISIQFYLIFLDLNKQNIMFIQLIQIEHEIITVTELEIELSQ